jgi:lipopolysaccharide/colanic/teichoic acid biosynthesis glycosyltransferase
MSAVGTRSLPGAQRGVGAARRSLDLVVSVTLLVLLSPALLVVALGLLLVQGRPVLYRQLRVGEEARLFTMYKFRTMVGGLGPEYTARGDPRVTPAGRALRATHIDELPQLVNVLRGEMTLVGPRPETPALARRYPEDCRVVLRFRPGLTGPCQVWLDRPSPPPGVDAEAFYLSDLVPHRVALDLRYLERPTLRGTLAVLAATASVLLGRRVRKSDAHP